MSRKIEWIVIIVMNIIIMPIRWLFLRGNIKFSLLQLVSSKAIIKSYSKGKIKLGKMTQIERGSLIQSNGGCIELGDNVYINRNCTIVSRKNISIGDKTTIGPNTIVYDHDHTIGINKGNDFKTASISIGKNVWIGANVIILKGVTIGSNSVIGAGAIITKDIPSKTIVTMQRSIQMRGIL